MATKRTVSKSKKTDKAEPKEKSSAMSFFDVAKNINGHGERLDSEVIGYNPFMMNRLYSQTPDSVLFANELNKFWNLPKQMQYDFYRYGLDRNPRRFGTWNKKESDDDIALIMEAFAFTRNKALEVYPILKKDMDIIRAYVFKGGKG